MIWCINLSKDNGLMTILCCFAKYENFISIALLNLNIVSSLTVYESILGETSLTGVYVAIILFNKVFLGYLYYQFLILN